MKKNLVRGYYLTYDTVDNDYLAISIFRVPDFRESQNQCSEINSTEHCSGHCVPSCYEYV